MSLQDHIFFGTFCVVAGLLIIVLVDLINLTPNVTLNFFGIFMAGSGLFAVGILSLIYVEVNLINAYLPERTQ